MSGRVDNLRRWIEVEISHPIGAPAAALVESIVNRRGGAVAAVLFYGSCVRRPDPLDGEDPVFDFHVVVDRYRDVYRNPLLALANWIVPPNVFYLEMPWRDRVLRAKCAVVSLGQLRRRVGRFAFHPYFWARLSQPTRLAFARGEDVRTAIVDILEQSVMTLIGRSIGLMQDDFTPRSLWTRAFRENYRSELRAEGPDRSNQIYEADRARYDAMAQELLAMRGIQSSHGTAGVEFRIGSSGRSMRRAERLWALRRLVGKLLSIVRLIKGAFTFDGAVRYILWKIERHSGIRADMTAWERRHPVLSAPTVAWRLYRRGAFR